jgi:glycosyltransferase involved in cell wall biosynthesis
MNTVWIDATRFFKRKPPLSGIPRVEAELVNWAKNNLSNVKLFEYHPASCSFTVFNEEISDSKLAPVPPQNSPQKPLAPPKEFFLKPSFNEIKLFAGSAVKAFYRMLLSFINIKYRENFHQRVKKITYKFNNLFANSVKSSPQPEAVKTGSGSAENVTSLTHTHPFKDGDSILFAGAAWEYKSINDEFSLIKKQIKLSIYVICHDLIPIKFPHLCLQAKGVSANEMFLPYFLGMTKIADHIFCVSKSTEIDLKEFTNTIRQKCPKTSVVTEGSHVVTVAADISPSAEIQDFCKTEFVLFVSTLERRKNHECIYKAVLYLLESGCKNLPKFVFVGKMGWSVNEFLSDLMLDPRTKDFIVLMHNITNDHDLKYLYEKTLFTLYPSFYEGWGLPVAESLNYGKMALVSSTSSMPEVGGDFVDYIHPYDSIGWANKIAFYLTNRDALSKKEQYIRKNYKKNYWYNFCKQVFDEIVRP